MQTQSNLNPPPPFRGRSFKSHVVSHVRYSMDTRPRPSCACSTRSVKVIVGGDRGAGARENRGREGYGRREKKGREAGSLRWREAEEKFKMASFAICYCLLPVKETNPRAFLDFHLTFSEAYSKILYTRKVKKTKIRARDKKNGITSCEIGNLSKSLTS